MKLMNTCRKYGAKLAVVTAAPLALAAQAYAAVPSEVTEALTEAKADTLSVGGIVLGIIVGIFALMLLRRVLK